jgi:hypothetical protein
MLPQRVIMVTGGNRGEGKTDTLHSGIFRGQSLGEETMSEDELIFIGAAILMTQTPVDDTTIRTAVTTARKLHSEVRKQLDEVRKSR